jgi:hypothetical protein
MNIFPYSSGGQNAKIWVLACLVPSEGTLLLWFHIVCPLSVSGPKFLFRRTQLHWIRAYTTDSILFTSTKTPYLLLRVTTSAHEFWRKSDKIQPIMHLKSCICWDALWTCKHTVALMRWYSTSFELGRALRINNKGPLTKEMYIYTNSHIKRVNIGPSQPSSSLWSSRIKNPWYRC